MSHASESDTPGAPERTEMIFFQALERRPSERDTFLAEACGSDERLRAEVAGLLEDQANVGSFLSAEGPGSRALEAEFAGLKPEAVGERIGPYKLLEQIGEGGFGTVWVAEQERPIQRRVALKIIKLGMDTKDVVARFEQERQALALMDHPNIARVLDAGATPLGRPFFVMELVRGIKFTDYCNQADLPTVERLRLFIQVCNAVQHAHQKGIIHRDLKPSNILVTLHDGVPVPKVIDFGVAKATQRQRFTDLTIYTRFEQMIGTPLYMAPEQAEMSGLDVDTRSDIYSLGVLLYELLTGTTPFDAQELLTAGFDEMRRIIREKEPQKPSTRLTQLRTASATAEPNAQSSILTPKSSIDPDLDWIVMKAIEKDRSRRYETASGLARDIERHLADEAVLARPPSAGYRFRRMVRRNKGAVAAAAGIAAALIIGSALSLWQAVRANAAVDQLRSSAPAFADQARSLAGRERFDEAIEKLDYATTLRPDVAEYVMAKADLLESQFRFAEAAPLYREALRLDPAEKRANANADLCDKLAGELAAQPHPSRARLLELIGAMTKEQRPAAQMLRIGKLLGEENKLILGYWLERLKDLPIPPSTPIEQRLTVNKQGELELDLSNSEISHLRPLEGMPLGSLNLTRCDKVTDVSPLRGMPLKTLVLDGTDVVDLDPLRSVTTLRDLRIRATKVRVLSPLRGLMLHDLDLRASRVSDLTPLQGMPLQTLKLAECPVADLTPLKGMPLKLLDLSGTQVADISPLAGMPLQDLDCTMIPTQDFSPLVLAGANLRYLSLLSTMIKDLSVLESMPLKHLNLCFCIDAVEFHKLGKIKSLEVLTLPDIEWLSEQDFAAIHSLPLLQSVINAPLEETLTKDRLQSRFDRILSDRKVFAEIVALSEQGRHSEAAQLMRGWFQRNPARVESDFPSWLTLGELLLSGGDTKGYQAICKEMTTRFRRRGQGDEAAVRLCLLSPHPGVPISDIRRLMPHLPLVRKTTPFRCWFVLTNGLIEYRAGRLPETIELLTEVQSDRFPSAVAAAAAGLSMALFGQGNLEAANAQLDRARLHLGPEWANRPPGNNINSFCDWLGARLLLQEAEELITGSANTRVGK